MKPSCRQIAYISVALNIIILSFLVGKRIYFYYESLKIIAKPPDYFDFSEKWNKARSSTFNYLPIDSTDVVFVGTSITDQFPLNEMFHTLHIKNRGIGSNYSWQIVKRIEPIIKSHPRKLFLEMGINDLEADISVDSLLTNYKTVIGMIKKESPRTFIYVESIFPVVRTKGYGKCQPFIEKFNPMLKEYCEKAGVTFVNIYPLLYKNDGLDSSLTWDGTHLNMEGYKLWKSGIEALVE